MHECDWIREAPASTHTTSRHTFHHQTIATHLNKQFSQVLVLNIAQADFVVACFCGFSDIHKYSGGLQMAPSPLDKQTTSSNFMIRLADEFGHGFSCFVLICGGENGTNGSHLAVFIVNLVCASHFVATHPPPPIGVLVILTTPAKTI